jgi:TPP-dependent pyruvate/acetoin dehydrogenase alpha subunit
MYRKMISIRRFEETVSELFYQGKIPGSVHLYIGQEAVAVGACAALSKGDHIISTHRGHGHLIARGADVNRMMAEIMGKETGLNSGKGGSLHIADFRLGILGACGIVGGGIPVATGAGLAARVLGDKSVTLCFFGEGASNEGTFHESLNMASLWGLPVVYICENNLYAVTTVAKESMVLLDIAERSVAYGIPGEVIDGNDVLAVNRAISGAVERARAGDGPTLVECKTYRWRGHFEGEEMVFPEGKRYRSDAEIEEWKQRDPIQRFRRTLFEDYGVSDEDLRTVEAEAERAIQEAVDFAMESPFPAPERSLEDLFA